MRPVQPFAYVSPRSALLLAARPALAAVAAVAAVLGLVAGIGACLRVLPWFFDAQVPDDVALSFGRSIALVACESVLVVAIPCGVALACESLVERGAWRALVLVGVSPRRVASWFAVPALSAALLLAVVSWNVAAQAAAPGELVRRLVDGGRVACERAPRATTTFVPFVRATWLCAPGSPSRLVVQTPARFGGTIVAGTRMHVGDDLTSLAIDDAEVALPSANVHVRKLSLSHIPPLISAATLSRWARAASAGLGALAAALGAAWGLVGVRAARAGKLRAVGVAVVGAASVLACFRLNERGVALGSAWSLMMAVVITGAGLPIFVCGPLTQVVTRWSRGIGAKKW